MRFKRLVVTIAAIIAVAVCGYFYWRSQSGSQSQSIMTVAAARSDIEVTVLATGTVKPVRLVAVGAQASGRITSVKVKLGQTVKTNDLIAEIDSTTQKNDLRTSEASLANMQAQLKEKQATLILNQQTLTRQKSMLAKHAVSQADYDTAAADLNVTQAQIESIKAQIKEAEVAVETARANLGYTQITAPIEGTVLSIVSQEGQTVNATQSAPTIVILGQLDRMTVYTEISEADIVRVKPGLPLYFTVLGDQDRRYEAKLESVEPAPESIKSDSSFSSSSSTSTSSSSSTSSEAIYYNGLFTVPNDDGHLRTYMTAEVHIVLGQEKNALTIPSSALGAPDADGRYTVRVVDDKGEITRKKIEIGLNNKVMVQVKSGLDEGDRVISGELAAGSAAGSGSGGRRGPPMGF
ncbi:efflux RND transporter periplasmic adaptor subunit [Ochrobactrum sp. RH2CCR150]|uniref:efflux RND transporter periplasmic adaptor subunit n=1 Tax=Ochrobactrum sp. RH2CCR150 TaxID=2587044 RepID=UPI0015FAE1AE|nr:macrolide-specific efflux system membrane fusion protein [Ochrobactrum sp. RH2CCR150]